MTSTERATFGRGLHSAWGYDLLAWVLLRGREPAFRRSVIDVAKVAPGDAVLDVGCGTGTLALLAKARTGASGAVHGIDASPAMIARARAKARRAAPDVTFDIASVEALPFADATFDVVLSTLMLHHLSASARETCAREIRRVTKSGGRVVVVDFGSAQRPRRRLFGHWHHRHGRVELTEVSRLLGGAGMRVTESGSLGMHDMWFVVACPVSP